MKIAIVSKIGHMECIGFLLELLKNCEVTIIINTSTDKHNWLEYFKSLYNFNIDYNFNINNKYDQIFKLTSNDDCLYSENSISLVHLKENQYINNKSKKYISLTPYIRGDDISYMFPIFKPSIIKSNSKIITMIGYYNNSNIDDDIIMFIKNNLDYQFIFVIWGDNYNNSNLKNNANVKILNSISTSELIQIINNSKYILSKKYINYDRFSGQLGLAMSFQKPMIIDYKTSVSYKLPGIIFNKNYCEINKLNDISDEKYNSIIEEIKIFNNNVLYNNTQIMKSFLCNIPFQEEKTKKNTVLLVEPRIIHYIPSLIDKYYKNLSDWNFVFYCGKNKKEYWKSILNNYVEIRELDVDNFNKPSEYSFFMKQKKLWESLYGNYVLTIQTDTLIMNIEPYTIDYFINLNKSYIGGNMDFTWYELKRENINFKNNNFNGGLSLRKRLDMIKVIECFPPILFNDKTTFSSNIQTDPEDVYFTLGCYKLGMPIGDDEKSSHFAVHKILKNGFFGFHQPSLNLKEKIIELYPELKNCYLF